jgi:hypothetical protein
MLHIGKGVLMCNIFIRKNEKKINIGKTDMKGGRQRRRDFLHERQTNSTTKVSYQLTPAVASNREFCQLPPKTSAN